MRPLAKALMRLAALSALLLAVALPVASAQSADTSALKPALQKIAGVYPVREIEVFGRDSARIVVEDPSRTVAALDAGTWTFGPAVTLEEAGGCPPQKVLGRRIAREFWRRGGQSIGVEEVIVRVHGSSGLDRLSYEDMYYGRPDLEGPWVGDRLPAR